MSSRTFISSLAMLALCGVALAQQPGPKQELTISERAALRKSLELKVLSIRVRGRDPLGSALKRDGSENVYGTGVIFVDPNEQTVQLLTAGHVLGKDSLFGIEQETGMPDRHVHLSALTDWGKFEIREAARRVIHHGQIDLARVYVNADASLAARFSFDPSAIDEGETVYIMPWPESEGRPLFVEARIGARRALDGPYIRILRETYETWSGAPVFDSEGHVVAILVQSVRPVASDPYSLAVPTVGVQAFLPSSKVTRPPRVDAVGDSPPPRLMVPDGQYRAVRGYHVQKIPDCQLHYVVNSVFVDDGTIKFQSDGRTWSGTIDQVTGMVNIGMSGIKPQPNQNTYIRGRFDDAELYNGFCGGGTFSLLTD